MGTSGKNGDRNAPSPALVARCALEQDSAKLPGRRPFRTRKVSAMSDMLATPAFARTSGGSGEAGRHPFDPDPVRSSKAVAVLVLGVAAVITGPLVGGIVPATLSLILARQARADLIAGRGYLTGARHLRVGLTLAWVGVALVAAALVAASVLGIISLARDPGQDFPSTSD
jgi:hydroxylaminobenzene mutase